jgi:hypothetical protein
MAIKHSSSVPETYIIVEISGTARQYYLLTALLFLGFYRLLPHSHGYYCATSLTFSNGTQPESVLTVFSHHSQPFKTLEPISSSPSCTFSSFAV